jgi:hypothetical protein
MVVYTLLILDVRTHASDRFTLALQPCALQHSTQACRRGVEHPGPHVVRPRTWQEQQDTVDTECLGSATVAEAHLIMFDGVPLCLSQQIHDIKHIYMSA